MARLRRPCAALACASSPTDPTSQRRASPSRCLRLVRFGVRCGGREAAPSLARARRGTAHLDGALAHGSSSRARRHDDSRHHRRGFRAPRVGGRLDAHGLGHQRGEVRRRRRMRRARARSAAIVVAAAAAAAARSVAATAPYLKPSVHLRGDHLPSREQRDGGGVQASREGREMAHFVHRPPTVNTTPPTGQACEKQRASLAVLREALHGGLLRVEARPRYQQLARRHGDASHLARRRKGRGGASGPLVHGSSWKQRLADPRVVRMLRSYPRVVLRTSHLDSLSEIDRFRHTCAIAPHREPNLVTPFDHRL